MAPAGSGFPRPKTKRSERVFTRHQQKNIAQGTVMTEGEVPCCGASRAWSQGRGAPGAIAGTWTGREVDRSAHMTPARVWGILNRMAQSAVQPRRATLLEKANMEVL